MNSQRHDSPRGIQAIGEVALSILSNAHHGSVLASVSNAIYMVSDSDELCWLIPMGGPMHQRGIQVAAPLPRLKVGSRYEVVDHTLSISSGETLDFQRAEIWKLPALSSNQVVTISRLFESLSLVADRLLAQHKPSGLGDLITLILRMRVQQDESLEISQMSVLTKKALPFIEEIIQASLANDIDLIIHYAKSLVGLGEGLTPSGDDFLGGFFFSRQLSYHHYPTVLDLSACTYSDFIHQSKPLTNLISHTILKDHNDGSSIESLHQLANGLLLGEPVDQLFIHAQKLISIGHSTGWDLLTGFLAGMSATLNQS